jgi:hypothetical protein
MMALGRNVHIFARPDRREELTWCFETVLGCPVRTVEHPAMDQPMLLVAFPGGGHLSIEFTPGAPDDAQPRLGAWLELRAEDPAAVMGAALEADISGRATDISGRRISVGVSRAGLADVSRQPGWVAADWPGVLVTVRTKRPISSMASLASGRKLQKMWKSCVGTG